MTSANKMPTELPEKRGPATLLVPERRSKGWWAGQTPLILAAVLVVSVAVRIVYYVEISGSPLRFQHQWDQTDMSYYDAWARDIAAGDWLSRNIAAPLHGWHHEIAEDYFRRRPAELARFQPAAAGTVDQFFGQHPEANSALEELIEARGKQYVAEHPQEAKSLRERVAACGLLWEEWLGPKRFYQEPLYPYLVALTYKVAGFDVRYVFAWQLLLGVLNNVLIYFVARRYFGATAAAVAALLAALCSPLLYLEMVLVRETLMIFAGSLLVLLASRAAQWRSLGWSLATGVAMGLSLTLKSHFAVFVLGALALLAIECRKSLKELVWLEAATMVGLVIGLAPLVARNVAVGVSPLSLGSAGAITFILGNVREAPSDASSFEVRQTAEIIGRTGGRFLPTVAATIATHGHGISYLAALRDKFTATWHWYEPPDNTNFYYYRLHAAVLRRLPVTFLILAPLGLMGLVVGFRRLWNPASTEPAERLWCAAPHLYLLVLTNLAVLMLFFVRDRFRAPLTASLIPLAALTIVLAAQRLQQRRWKNAAMIAGGVVLLALFTAWPLPPETPLIRPVDCFLPYQLYYDPMEQQARHSGDYQKAAEILADSLNFQPEIVKRLALDHPARSNCAAVMGRAYADVYYRSAKDYHLAGRAQDAARQRARADELNFACRAYPR